MRADQNTERIRLEGGPRHGSFVERPKLQHATIFEAISGFARIDGVPTDRLIAGFAVYQYFEEYGRAFWAHNEWEKSN